MQWSEDLQDPGLETALRAQRQSSIVDFPSDHLRRHLLEHRHLVRRHQAGQGTIPPLGYDRGRLPPGARLFG